LARWRRGSDLVSFYTKYQNEFIKVRGYPEWYIVGRTAVNSAGEINVGLQGIHAPYLLFIVDEASGVPDPAIDSIESSGSGEDSYGLMLSNPTRRSGYFYNAFHKNREFWVNVHVRPGDSSRMSPRFMDRLEKKYGGKQANGYKIRVLGEFPTAEDTGLVTYEEYAAVQRRDVGWWDIPDAPPLPRGYVPPTSPTTGKPILPGYVRMAIDPGGDGPESDATTMCVRKGNYILDIFSMHSMSIPEISAKAKDKIEQYGVERLIVDAIGIGKGLVEQLQVDYAPKIEDGKIEICKVQVGKRASRKDEFTNLRAELYYLGAQAIKNKGVWICADLPYLEEDLTGLHKSYTSSRKLYIESKVEYRKRNEGRSTDYSDAFILTFYSEEGDVEDLPDPVSTLATIVVNNDNRLVNTVHHFRDAEIMQPSWQKEAIAKGEMGEEDIRINSHHSNPTTLAPAGRTLSSRMATQFAGKGTRRLVGMGGGMAGRKLVGIGMRRMRRTG
jgi:phage terminase large subunit